MNNIRVLHIYCSFCIHIQAGLICNFETECLNGICHDFFFFCLLCGVLNTCVVGERSTVFSSEVIGLATVKFGFSRQSDVFYDLWPCIVTDSLWIKPIDALNCNFIGITTLHVSGSLSAHHQEYLAVHRLWYILHLRSSQLHKMYQSRCTAKNSRWWAERLPETCRVVIPIKLEFSASVGFIPKVPCPYTKNWPEDGSLEPKHVANCLLIDYICVVFDWIHYIILKQ